VTVEQWVGHWTLDPGRSEVTFHSPSFWGLLKVKGRFTKLTGSGRATGPDGVSGEFTIDAASVSTGIGKRDQHLRSADFFDVEKFPKIEVIVASADSTGPAAVELHADLTIKGMARHVDLPAEVTTLADGAVRLTVATALNRLDFGVDGNLLGMMGDTTDLEATAVFVRQS
jgi:polyisoprenoid-binding protein YceI